MGDAQKHYRGDEPLGRPEDYHQRSETVFGLLRRGDRDAAWQLLAEELPWIVRRARHKLRCHGSRPTDTLDLVHEVATQVLQRCASIRAGSRTEFHALLARMVENELRSTYARQRTRPLPTLAEEVFIDLATGRASSDISPPEAAMVAEEAAFTRIAIELLGDEDQELAQMILADLPDKAIGAALGIAPDAARMRRMRFPKTLDDLVRRLKAGQARELILAHSRKESPRRRRATPPTKPGESDNAQA